MIAEESRNFASMREIPEDDRPCPAESNTWQAATQRIERKCASGIASHPLVTTVVAVAMGVTLGWLIKRR